MNRIKPRYKFTRSAAESINVESRVFGNRLQALEKVETGPTIKNYSVMEDNYV